MMSLAGRVAIVTGAANGIGRAVALALARERARVVVCDIDGEGTFKVAEEIAGGNGECLAFQVDVTNAQDIDRLVAQTLDRYDRIDFLMNNAGIAGDAKFTDLTENQWRRMLDVNLTSMFLCCKAIVPVMIDQGAGKIVNASSQAAFDGSSEAAHYAASKAGVIGLTRSLARELGPYNITVNLIAPGIIQTAMNPAERLKAKGEGWLKRLPLKRFGLPEDVAEVVLFLLSDAADYITGQSILINGGMRMGA
jgi:NAD(P)-dependent dehydrogenase (short-subunit alcohol dehydrogenase family)